MFRGCLSGRRSHREEGRVRLRRRRTFTTGVGAIASANRARLEGGQGLVARGHGEVDVAVAERGVRVVLERDDGVARVEHRGGERGGRRRGERVAAPRLDRANLVVVVRGGTVGVRAAVHARRARGLARVRRLRAAARGVDGRARVRAGGGRGGDARVLRPREGTRVAPRRLQARELSLRALQLRLVLGAPPVPRPARLEALVHRGRHRGGAAGVGGSAREAVRVTRRFASPSRKRRRDGSRRRGAIDVLTLPTTGEGSGPRAGSVSEPRVESMKRPIDPSFLRSIASIDRLGSDPAFSFFRQPALSIGRRIPRFPRRDMTRVPSPLPAPLPGRGDARAHGTRVRSAVVP